MEGVLILDSCYTKLKFKYCSRRYGEYDTVEEAKLACTSDFNCQAVYDIGCDGHKNHYLCSSDSVYMGSHMSSCVYHKGCPGNILYLACFVGIQ